MCERVMRDCANVLKCRSYGYRNCTEIFGFSSAELFELIINKLSLQLYTKEMGEQCSALLTVKSL